MQQNEFEALLKEICQKENLPQALELLKACEEEEVAQAAESLTGQFGLAEVEGEKRIYTSRFKPMNRVKRKNLLNM